MWKIKLKNTTPGDGEVVILSNAKEYEDGWTGDDEYGETRHYPAGLWKAVTSLMHVD